MAGYGFQFNGKISVADGVPIETGRARGDDLRSRGYGPLGDCGNIADVREALGALDPQPVSGELFVHEWDDYADVSGNIEIVDGVVSDVPGTWRRRDHHTGFMTKS